MFPRKHSTSLSRQPGPKTPSAEPSDKKRHEGGWDDKGRRRSISDPAKRMDILTPRVGEGWGLLKKMGLLLSFSPDTPRIYYSGKGYYVLPLKKLVPLTQDILASYSGPDGGLTNGGLTAENGHSVTSSSDDDLHDNDGMTGSRGVNGHCKLENTLSTTEWNCRNEKAYGMSLSLYEYTDKDKQSCTGDPIADVFAIRATSNGCIMAVADGVGWGQGARKAARCAVKGSMDYIWKTLSSPEKKFTTADVFKCMRDSIDEAQELIISQDGSLTTLCLAVVADIMAEDTSSRALCVLSVGDSLAFVCSQQHGVKEVTVGCREYSTHRNIRFCDGALGPCLGEEPDLTNLTFSYTTVKEGDIVFLTSDGISDNFDPVIAQKAVPNSDFKSRRSRAEMMYSDDRWDSGSRNGKIPIMTPRDRQEEMTRMMDTVIRNTEVPSNDQFSASSLCSKLLQYVVNLTEKKREAHEATNHIISVCEKERLESTTMMTGKEALYRHTKNLPGKLDHATVVAYVVGHHTPTVSNADSSFTSRCDELTLESHPRDKVSNYFDLSVGNKQNKDLISLID